MLVTSIVNPSHLKQLFLDMKRTIGGSKVSSRKIKMYHSISYLETTTKGTSFPVYISCQLKDPTSLGQSSSFSPHAYTRYTSHFGAPNFEVSLANHTLIMFDAPSYADEDAKRHGQKKSVDEWVPIPGGSLEFMKRFTSGKLYFKVKHKNAVFSMSSFEATHTDPVILFSHIPMYRHDGKSCGPLREKGTLRPGVGPGYQNTLEKHASKRLLEALKPIAVFR